MKKLREWSFIFFTWSCLGASLGAVILLFGHLLLEGIPRIDWGFLTSYPSRFAAKAGILSALAGSVVVVLVAIITAFPFGLACAVYLEEYAPESWYKKVIEVTIVNLAAVPSIIFGLLGLQVFVRWAGLGRSVLAGGLTLALLVLPVLVLTIREAIKQVPNGMREAAYALGALKSEVIWDHVLPAALSGIMTGTIFATSRALGETAPLIAIGAVSYAAFLPDSPFSEFTALPLQIFQWVSRPQEAFHTNAAAAIVVLLFLLLLLNSAAVVIRIKTKHRNY